MTPWMWGALAAGVVAALACIAAACFCVCCRRAPPVLSGAMGENGLSEPCTPVDNGAGHNGAVLDAALDDLLGAVQLTPSRGKRLHTYMYVCSVRCSPSNNFILILTQ
jgi:hypothetical protein